jgi:hypothetical protein
MRSSVGVLLGICLAVAGTAEAEIGAVDGVPAATLLLPYFEVDLADPQGRTTLFSINNAAAEPAIAHVTLWTDVSVPTLDFNVFLTGYDVVTFNLRDLFATGTLPQTSHRNTSVSPRGVLSNETDPASGIGPGSTSCDEQLPLPPLPAALLDHIRAAHTGRPSPLVFAGRCAGAKHVEGGSLSNVARGYVTIDSVNFCSLAFPDSLGYFQAGGTGTANNRNVLWGDVMLVDPARDSAQGLQLLHLEADDSLGPANYTFYRRYSGGFDQREGLGSVFAVRYLLDGVFEPGTELIAWRDSTRSIAPFNCALPFPSPFPLGMNNVLAFDEQENISAGESLPFSPPIPGALYIPFPYESSRLRPITNLYPLGEEGLIFPIPDPLGWFLLDLNTTVAGSQVPFSGFAQAHVQALHTAQGRFSVGVDAIALSNVTVPEASDILDFPACDGDPDPPACEDF